MRSTQLLGALCALLVALTSAQQYAGEVIKTSLRQVPGSEIAYFKIPGVMDSNSKKAANLTLINYYSHGSDGKRLVESKVQRAVIIIHGLNRDPDTYESNMLSALAQVTGDSNVNKDSVAVMSPYFPNGDDKRTGYPWTDGLSAGRGSTTSALVWKGSQWSAGGNNQYPYYSQTASSYAVLDALVQYFDDRSLFPNMKQIVVAGHSLGAQTVHRYAALGKKLDTKSAVTYWVGNPNSYIWLSTERPLSTAQCPTYDYYRDGYTNFTEYPMTYGQSLVTQGRSAILANYQSKQIAYARGTQDLGDDSSSCGPGTTGGNRNERFFNFIKAFPASCDDPRGTNCDTVDLVNMGHDGGGMMASPAGRARLFTDNFYGNGNRSYDFGYPRQQDGDDPFPDPTLNSTTSSVNNNTYAGNLTYAGCWSDSAPMRSLPTQAYDNGANTIELCTSTCVSRGFSIAGLQFGSQCYCGNALTSDSTKVLEASCGRPCTGNNTQSCGGDKRLSVFSNGRPYVLSPPSSPDTIGKFSYSGCYTETSSRSLSGKATSGNFMSLDYCASFCGGYKYFGTEYSSECYCGNAIDPLASIAPASDCSQICANNTAQYCGAGNRLTLYTNPEFFQPTGSSSSSTPSTPTSPPVANGPACPASNNTVVVSNGLNFTIECGVDHAGGDLTALDVSSFQQCIDACSSNKECVDVSLSGSACYLKKVLNAAVNAPAIWGAKLVQGVSPASTSSTASSSAGPSSSQAGSSSTTSTSVSSTSSNSVTALPSAVTCPASNATTYTATSGREFVIECGVDHQAGDMGSRNVNSFSQCIDACDQTSGCVDVSLSGSACYLKSSVGAAVNAPWIWGARLVTPSASSTSSNVGSASSSTIPSVTGSSSASRSATLPASATDSVSSSTASSTASRTPSSTGSSVSGTPTAVTCPASNDTIYTVPSGKTYLIECGIDHQGGDLSSKRVDSFAECIAVCDNTATCVDVALAGDMCYLKSSVGPAIKLNHIWGAKLVTSSSSSLSASATSRDATSSSTSSGVSATASGSMSTSASNSAETWSSTPASSTSSDLGSSSSLVSSSTTSSASNLTGEPASMTSSEQSLTASSASSISSTPSSATSTTSAASDASSSATTPSTTASSSSIFSTTSAVSSAISSATTSSSAISSTTTSSSAASLPSGFSYAGCFVDSSTRVLPISNGTASTQTQQQCAMNCHALGYKYSGTEYASECWCGNSAPTNPASESQCSMACKGDSTQKCGAGNRLSVVSDDSWKQTFFARQSFQSWDLLGCYTDSTAKRSLPSSVSLAAFGGSARASIANCLQACQARGFAYCGAEYYSECYGSNAAPATSLASGADPLTAGCNFPCKSNSTESCGGSSRIIVYGNKV